MTSTDSKEIIVLENKKIGKHLKHILKHMCEAVDIKYSEVDFYKQDWQEKHSWTVEKEKEFQAWLKIYFDSNPEAIREITRLPEMNRPNFEKVAFYFTLFYGWALIESDYNLLDKIEENKIN
jgi:hypothetical protein